MVSFTYRLSVYVVLVICHVGSISLFKNPKATVDNFFFRILKSNIKKGSVLLLPEDPDKTSRDIKKKIEYHTNKKVSVIMSDTFGRAWRKGQTNVAIGSSGIVPLESYIGEKALQLCHWPCMVPRNVEIAIMIGLEHGNEGVERSPKHWGIRHLQSHSVHSNGVFWIDLEHSRLFSTGFHTMVGI